MLVAIKPICTSIEMWVLLTFGTFLVFSGSAAASNASYAIFAPKTLRRGSDYQISVFILKSSADVFITAQLLDVLNSTVAQTKSTFITGLKQSLVLKIPSALQETSLRLVVSAVGGLQFQQFASVDIKSKTLSLFVQTDKAIYKPGQRVLYRAIAVYPELQPFKGPVAISIYDQAGNKITQLKDKSNETGVISGELLLSEQTPLGSWKIQVKAAGNEIEKNFDVAEYVLPKFKVEIDLPSFYLINSNQPSLQPPLTVTVTAKYTFGQPVKGSVVLAVQILPVEWIRAKYPQKLYSATLTDGKYEVKVPIHDILQVVPSQLSWQDDKWQALSSQAIRVNANVTELATGKMLSASAAVECHDRRYELKFMDISPNNYKRGLIYTGYIQLSQVDGSQPLASDVGNLVTLTVTTFLRDTINQKLDFSVTETGIMQFSLHLAHSDSFGINLQATFQEASGKDIYSFKKIEPFKSRDSESIQVSVASTDVIIKAGETMKFHVELTVPLTSFNYQILSKGKLVISDTVTGSNPRSDHEFNLAFTEALTQLLMPRARLVTWAVTGTGEIISDSLEINVAASFANKVALSFSKTQTEPGDHISLMVNAHQGSYIGLLAVDQSVLLLKSGNDITHDMVLNEMAQYDSRSKQRNFIEDRRCVMWPVFTGGEDSSEIFENAGLIVMTDAYIYKSNYFRFDYSDEDELDGAGMADGDDIVLRRAPMFMSTLVGASQDTMSAMAPPESESDEPSSSDATQQTVPRVVFPETWLWSETIAGNNGSVTVKVTVPDTITSWVASAFAVSDDVGLGVAPLNAQLTVFKPFFVSLNLPYSVIRGEEFALKVTVFNYLTTDAQVLVSLRKSTDFRVRHINAIEPEEVELSENVLVSANDVKTVYFWIVPKSLGQIPIEVHAQSNAAGDAERRLLLVKPEGVPQEYSTSVFIDLTKEDSDKRTLFVSLPPTGVVPDSQQVQVTVIGDLLGPSINGLDKLIQMPYGCGEQNMLKFAPNIYIMNYLNSTNQLSSNTADKSLIYMTTGYQRELTYQRTDGSFSAFGNSDPAGSLWLSSFVAKCFHEAKDYIPIEDGKIASTVNWIMSLQSPNGAFIEPPNGRVIHTDMQGGSSKGVALTAYVLIALLENNDTQHVDKRHLQRAVNQAQNYLESQLTSIGSDPYALSIISFALALAGSAKATAALNMLNELAVSKDGLMHWEKKEEAVLPKDELTWEPPYSQSRAVNIEMTSYALLSCALRRDISGGVPIAKWIISQRNPNGGFSSTQDTVMALQALAAFASLTTAKTDDNSELNISAVFGESTHDFVPINRKNALLLQTVEIPSTIQQVEIMAHGNGVGLVQLNVGFNKFDVDEKDGVVLTVSTVEQDNVVSVTACGRWTNTDRPSGMVVMDISQLTGFSAMNLDEIRRNVGLKRVDNDDNNIVLYFDELTREDTCLTVKSEKIQMVSNIQKAAVRLYSYYDPSSIDTEFYLPPEASANTNLCSSCPQCCGHPEPQPVQRNTAPRALSGHVTSTAFLGLLVTFTVASLLSCLLVV